MASSFSSSWPDPNSSAPSRNGFGVPFVELFKWFDVRDTFLGRNFKKQDFTAALDLAHDCNHPDALWLTSIFEGKDVSTKEDAKKVFLCFESDGRALCFAWCLTYSRDLTMLRCSSAMGNAFACSLLCHSVWNENKQEALRLAHFAASQHERDGYFELGCYFYGDGDGFEKDLSLAKENYLIAAELGNVLAAKTYGKCLDESDPARWYWWSRAALQGLPRCFLDFFSKQVKEFFSGSGNATVVFLIGRALKGNIDMEKMEIFGNSFYFLSLFGPAKQAVSFYDAQIKAARLAVDAWTLVAFHFHFIKDMRMFVSKMIWEARFEASYKL